MICMHIKTTLQVMQKTVSGINMLVYSKGADKRSSLILIIRQWLHNQSCDVFATNVKICVRVK